MLRIVRFSSLAFRYVQAQSNPEASFPSFLTLIGAALDYISTTSTTSAAKHVSQLSSIEAVLNSIFAYYAASPSEGNQEVLWSQP